MEVGEGRQRAVLVVQSHLPAQLNGDAPQAATNTWEQADLLPLAHHPAQPRLAWSGATTIRPPFPLGSAGSPGYRIRHSLTVD